MLLLLFFVIELYFLIPVEIAQIFIPSAELIIRTGPKANEVNAQIKTESVTVKTKQTSVQVNLNTYMSSYIFHSLIYYVLFHLKDNFLFHQFFLV